MKVTLKLRDFQGQKVVYYDCQTPGCGQEHWVVLIRESLCKLPGVEEKLKQFVDFVLEADQKEHPCLWGQCGHYKQNT